MLQSQPHICMLKNNYIYRIYDMVVEKIGDDDDNNDDDKGSGNGAVSAFIEFHISLCITIL
jgi:hypothetical protein